MARFLHTADWQLGMTRRFLDAEAQARFSGARLDAVGRIGELAMRENCSFVLVCGDVFESNQVDRQMLARALERMRSTPQIVFYLLPGNHDPLDASSVFRSPTFTGLKPGNVTVLRSREPVKAAPGLELVPSPLADETATGRPGGRSLQPARPHRRGPCGGRPRSCRLAVADPSDPALISLAKLEERIDSGLVHYAALGDRHSTTDVGGSGRVWYSGAPEPTDYTEGDPGNVLLVDLDTDSVRVDVRRVGTWSFVRRSWELSSSEDIDGLREWLDGLGGKERTVVKAALVGQVSVARKAQLDSMLDHFADLFAALEKWERRSDLAVIPDTDDIDGFGFSGFASEALADLRELAQSGEHAVAARDALALLHRLAGTTTRTAHEKAGSTP